jgi:hypothetical protein
MLTLHACTHARMQVALLKKGSRTTGRRSPRTTHLEYTHTDVQAAHTHTARAHTRTRTALHVRRGCALAYAAVTPPTHAHASALLWSQVALLEGIETSEGDAVQRARRDYSLQVVCACCFNNPFSRSPKDHFVSTADGLAPPVKVLLVASRDRPKSV